MAASSKCIQVQRVQSLFAFQGLGTLAISERVCIDIQLERFNVNFFEKRTNAIKPTPAPSIAICYKCFKHMCKKSLIPIIMEYL